MGEAVFLGPMFISTVEPVYKTDSDRCNLQYPSTEWFLTNCFTKIHSRLKCVRKPSTLKGTSTGYGRWYTGPGHHWDQGLLSTCSLRPTCSTLACVPAPDWVKRPSCPRRSVLRCLALFSRKEPESLLQRPTLYTYVYYWMDEKNKLVKINLQKRCGSRPFLGLLNINTYIMGDAAGAAFIIYGRTRISSLRSTILKVWREFTTVQVEQNAKMIHQNAKKRRGTGCMHNK